MTTQDASRRRPSWKGVPCSAVYTSQAGLSVGRADARLQTQAFWSLAIYLLNVTLFVLVELEAPAAVRSLSGTDLTGALVTVAVVSVTLAVVRFTFLTASTCTIRLLTVDRRPQQLERRMGHRARVVSALAGFRGAVSLALTLARSSHAWTSVVNE
ncbi:hypothetical protein ACFSL4_30810 [Streptomyces caeni]|uniref:Uncharacterized protein n=1 Tax=Streptomyces caeni TaxID=2307231 RepID=A0ABW4IYZ5_9ACTN